MRFLFTSSPLLGHLQPLLPLARAARDAGHDVVIASGPDLAGWVERHGFQAWSVGPSMTEIREAMARRSRPDGETDEQVLAANVLGLFARPSAIRAVELMARTLDTGVDVVVSEPYELGGGYVRASTGLRAVHGLGADVEDFAGLAAFAHAEMARLVGGADLTAQYLATPYLDPFPLSLQPRDRPWARVFPIRPETPLAAAPAEPVPEFADLPYRRSVYLTLGTVFNAREAFAAPLAALADLPVNVLLTTGGGVDPSALGEVPGNVRVAGFVPQGLILPRVSAVVCHGGAGTVLGALAHGVPLVCLPMGADQPGNAAAVAAGGTGLQLTPEQADAASIRSAVERVLNEDRFRRAAGRLRDEIADLPTPDEVIASVVDRVTRPGRAPAMANSVGVGLAAC